MGSTSSGAVQHKYCVACKTALNDQNRESWYSEYCEDCAPHRCDCTLCEYDGISNKSYQKLVAEYWRKRYGKK